MQVVKHLTNFFKEIKFLFCKIFQPLSIITAPKQQYTLKI